MAPKSSKQPQQQLSETMQPSPGGGLFFPASPSSEQLVRGQSLTSVVAERLKARIMDGSIPLGSLLSEKTLAESFGVSKTPVREALVQLQAIGLVTILPQRGGRVFSPDVEQVRELLEVRHELEAAGLRLSMERNAKKFAELLSSVVSDMEECFDFNNPEPYLKLGDTFHDALFVYCGNSLLARAYQTFAPRISALKKHLSPSQIYILKRSLEEHQLIRDLVADGDQATALRLLREHVMELHRSAILSAAESERTFTPPVELNQQRPRQRTRQGPKIAEVKAPRAAPKRRKNPER